MADFYLTLELPRSANSEEIRGSYKRLVKVWHPDKNPDNLEEATTKFKEIQLAFQVLSDKNQRAVYDDIIRNGEQRGNSADPAASNGEKVKEKGRSRNAENSTDNWSNVRAEHSKRGGRSTRVNCSIFGSVLRRNKHFGSAGDDLGGKDQECESEEKSMQNNITSRDVFRRHSILTSALRFGNQQSKAKCHNNTDSGERDQKQDLGDGEERSQNHSRQTLPGRGAKYRRAGLLSSLLRKGSIDT